MYKPNLKRAKIKLMQVDRMRSDRDLYRMIETYQAALNELIAVSGRTPALASRVGKEYINEIRKTRELLRKPRTSNHVYDIYLPEFKMGERIIKVYDYNLEKIMGKIAYKRELYGQLIQEAIGTIRRRRRGLGTMGKFGGVLTTFLGKKGEGRVFNKTGEVLALYIVRNLGTLYTDKVPTESRKYIGIELEFCAPIKKNEFAVKLFQRGIHKFAQLKADGSLRPHEGEEGFELAILLEETNYKKNLKKITDLLTEIKATATDRRCGLHVHLDMRKREKEVVYNNFVAAQYALLSVVDPRRYDTEFCRVVHSRKFPTEFTGDRQERYKTINAAAYYKYKTLEIRMHEGSVDYKQITNWVDLLVRIANYSKKFKDSIGKLEVLKKRLKLNKKVYEYILDRSCTWQIQHTEAAQHMRQGIARRIPNPNIPEPPRGTDTRLFGTPIQEDGGQFFTVAANPPTPGTTLNERLRRATEQMMTTDNLWGNGRIDIDNTPLTDMIEEE